MFSNARDLVITGGSFSTGLVRRFGFEDLHRHISPGALHNSGEFLDQPRCHPDTRVAVLEAIMAWVENFERESSTMWLHGPAGAGKSAIARSIAELCAALNLLIASFFFSRHADGRKNTERLISTIAYQLAQNIPDTRPHIESVVENDPAIFSKSLADQIQALIVRPLQSASGDSLSRNPPLPCLIIIDGLDECHDAEVQIHVLHLFANLVQRQCGNIRLAFLVVSRPEKHLRASFSHVDLAACSTMLLLDDTFKPDDDIRLFLISKCNEIKNRHTFKGEIPDVWPSPGDIETLVKKSSGQFIFASVVVKYVGAINQRPVKRLQVVLGLSPTNNANPFMELDALYHHILASVEDISIVLCILGIRLVENFICPRHDSLYARSKSLIHELGPFDESAKNSICLARGCNIGQFLSLEPGDLRYNLADLQSVLLEISDDECDITFFHASLLDYLKDSSRSKEFHIDKEVAHADSAMCYIKLLKVDGSPKPLYDLFNALGIHLRDALLTNTLQNALQELDLLSFMYMEDIDGTQLGLPYLEDIIACLQESQFPDAKKLLKQITSKIDQHLRIHLPKYQVDQSLQDLVVLAAIGATSFEDNVTIDFWKDLKVALANKNLIQVDRQGLSLLTYLCNRSRRSLATAFRDPQRSGKLFVTGGQIAALALRSMKSAYHQKLKMLQDPSYIMEANYAQFISWTVVNLLDSASPSKHLALYMEQPDIKKLIEPQCDMGIWGNAYTKYLDSFQDKSFHKPYLHMAPVEPGLPRAEIEQLLESITSLKRGHESDAEVSEGEDGIPPKELSNKKQRLYESDLP
ncbi:hypothetical protein B0H34DRAFT_801390 [Crassisporium funariophilum]|nr:hypothetical protein B0H34DRAFT_801390 [Crassisporium funariophilum]